MSKFKQIQPDTWDAHVKRASSSADFAKEYKKVHYVLDRHKIMAQKIKDGDYVGEEYIFGRGAAELVHHGYVRKEELIPYQKALLADIAKHKDYTIKIRASKDDDLVDFNPYEEIKQDLLGRFDQAMKVVQENS